MKSWCKLPKGLIGRIGTRDMVLLSVILDRNALVNGQEQECAVVLTVKEACETLRCSKPTAIKTFRVLENAGYIRRVRNGFNRPDSIYVNSAIFLDDCGKESLLPEVKKVDHQKSKKLTTGSKKPLPPEVKKVDPLHIDKTYDSRLVQDRQNETVSSVSDSEDGFNEWFASYPRKNCSSVRERAREEYHSALSKYSVRELKDAVDNYASEVRKNNTPDKYISLPQNFLKLKVHDYMNTPKSEHHCINGVCYTGLGEQVYGYWLLQENNGTTVYPVLGDGRVSQDTIRIDGNIFNSPDGKYWCNTPDNYNPFMSVCFLTHEAAVAATTSV